SSLLHFVLFYIKLPPKNLQIIIIVCWHLLAFLFNFQSVSIITFYAFVYIIAILTIYRSSLILAINILLILLEIYILYKLSFFSFSLFNSQVHFLFFSFLSVICVVSSGQRLSIMQIWIQWLKNQIN